jgi:hypothetical protein
MSELANTLQFGAPRAEICRDERCELLDVHVSGAHCVKLRGRESLYRTRSRRHATQPWRAYSYEALHESVYTAVSLTEPRSFAMVLSFVENDYGTCCERSVHRHLSAWRLSGEIVRLDFKGRIHAYLRAGSRLIRDPELVLEQIIDVHAEAMSWAEGTGTDLQPWKRRNGGMTDAANDGADWCALEAERLARA